MAAIVVERQKNLNEKHRSSLVQTAYHLDDLRLLWLNQFTRLEGAGKQIRLLSSTGTLNMKIQKVTEETRGKVYALLRCAFPGSAYESELVQNFHKNGKPEHEWVCIHTNKVIAYLAFSNAYHGKNVCGLHLAPMAVAPEFQKQGVGSELLRFALRQEPIKNQTLFVLGEPGYYKRFGFEPCSLPVCPFDKDNAHFLSMRNNTTTLFIVGYEPEFRTAAKPSIPQGKKRRR
jgi:putative acetyltransferase